MESWALPGNATRSESLRAGAEPTSHPESPPSPSTRSTGLGLSSWWEPSPLPPLSRPLLPGQRHDVSDPIRPKDLEAHFGEGDAAKARMELPPACRGADRARLAAVLGSGAHRRCGHASVWLNPIPPSTISHPPLSATCDLLGSTGLLGKSSVKTRLF